jgi:hypothetical protein
LTNLRLLAPAAFGAARHRLPVPSFTALWKTLTPAAAKCSFELKQLADGERAEAKMLEERQQANSNLHRAASLLESDPDRALQLARNAITASGPMLLDIPGLTYFLSNLRDRAGDLSDELFPEALDLIASARQPSPGLLLELGKYLFTSSKYLETPDATQASDTSTVGSTSIANFTANRKSASSDDIRQYIEASVKVLTATNSPFYDPVAAYAIAFQMLPKADEFAPEQADALREALVAIVSLAGSSVAKVQAAIGGSPTTDPEGGEAAHKRDRLVGRALAAIASNKFAEARDMLAGIDDLAVRSQVTSLIDFAESAAAIERRDRQAALTLANSLRGGVKRAILYAGLAAASQDRSEAFGYLDLGLHDSQLLPAERRMAVATGLSGATLRIDAESAINALNAFVDAANAAYTSPRQGRFDPQAIRRSYKASTFTDSSLILANRRCLCEVVDTGRGRHTYKLSTPGVPNMSLTGVVRNASGLDIKRLEGILLGLRDEVMVDGLNALAALRFDY